MRSAPTDRNGVLRVGQSGTIPEAGALFPSIRSLGLNGLDLGHAVLQVREIGDGHDVGKERPQRPELGRLGFGRFGEIDILITRPLLSWFGIRSSVEGRKELAKAERQKPS